MLLDHADFALREQAKDNLMVAFSCAWYNGSYTIAAKPIKSLELHYTMIQFFIIKDVKDGTYCCYCAYTVRPVYLEILVFPMGGAHQYRSIFARFMTIQRKQNLVSAFCIPKENWG